MKKNCTKLEAEQCDMRAEMDRLRDQSQRDKKELAKALERVRQV